MRRFVLALCLSACDSGECPRGSAVSVQISETGERERVCERAQAGGILRHGAYAQSDRDGHPLEVGAYTRGKKSGEWRRFFANGQLRERGRYDEELREGEWAFFDDAGVALGSAVYKADALERVVGSQPSCPAGATLFGDPPPRGVAVWCQRHDASGALVNEGPFASWYPDGRLLARGTYVAGVQHGQLSMWYPNGQRKAEAHSARGVAQGLSLSWHDNGQKFIEAHFVDGEEEGPWVSWWEEGGKAAEGSFKHGWEEGAWTFWYPNGRLQEVGTFHHGKRDGEWQHFNPEGQGEATREYHDGVEVSATTLPGGP